MSGWESAAEWWLDLISDDPIFSSDVLPLLETVCGSRRGLWLDLGAGTGRVSAALDGDWVSCDVAEPLLRHIPPARRPVRCRLPDLEWLRAGSLGGAVAVLVVEHIAALEALFAGLHRVVSDAGAMAVVMNHPAFTAEGAGPVIDAADGEVLYRWGDYFLEHTTSHGTQPEILFHHRPLGRILDVAAGVGWSLQHCIERALSPAAVAAHPGYTGHEHIPRLLALRWTRA